MIEDLQQINPHYVDVSKRTSRYLGIIVAGLGALVLLGWVLNVPALKSIMPGLATMKFNTALLFLLAGVSLATLNPRLRQISAVAVVILAALTLAEYAFGWNLGIDELLVHDFGTVAAGGPYPGRPSIVTAVDFVLVGSGVLLLTRRSLLFQSPALFAGFLALVALVGYSFNVEILSRVGPYSSMALHTALAFIILSLSILLANTDSELMRLVLSSSAGGALMRRLLPITVLGLLLIGWLQYQGYNRLGLYDAEFGSALMTVLNITMFTVVVRWAASYLQRIDLQRLEADAALRRANDELELRVQERTAEVHDLYDNAPCGYHSLDKDGLFVQINATELRWLGYIHDEVVGKMRFTDVISAESLKVFQQNFPMVKERGWVNDLEYDMVRKDGTTFKVALSSTVLKDAAGNYLSSRSSVFDITERKHTQARYRILLEHLPDTAVIMFDPEMRYVLADGPILRTTGYSQDQMLGKTIFEVLPPASQQALLPMYQRVLQGESFQFERQAENLYYDSRFVPVHDLDGKIINGLIVVQDITRRKQAERELLESEKRYHILFDTIDEGFCIIEMIFDNDLRPSDFRFLEINRSFEKQSGLIDAQGKRMRELAPQHEEHWFETFGKVAVTGQPTRFVNYAEQLHRWFEVHALRIGQPEDRQVAVLFTDITERKDKEQQIAALNETLERRAVELEATNKELEAFSYSVSHDLRAPLRSIDGFSQVLLEDYLDQLDSEGQGYLQRIRNAANRMADLIDDLINLSRITRTEMRREQVDLSLLAQGVAADLQQRQPERQVEYAISDGLVANADARLLRVVFENLMGNAWKFTSKHPQARIEVGVMETHENGTAYFVRDDGDGFDMTYADKLFGAFQRLHDTNEFEGTGIGLATVQRVIHRHGGKIWAVAEVGKGATFYFTL